MAGSGVRGRIDLESQISAIARVVALAPHREAIRAALDRVTTSTAFKSSKRAQDFLRYVVDRAMAGELDHLKERGIGCSLFGREPDYDTGTDSIVRVTANDVRKRLTLYYQQITPSETVIIELPSGTYIPEIRLEAPERPAAPAEPEAPAPVAAPDRAAPRFGWQLGAVVGWAAVVILLIAFAATRPSPKESSSETLRTLPWTSIFAGGRQPMLILADSAMGSLRMFAELPVSVEDYANRKFMVPPPHLPAEKAHAWQEMAVKQMTSLADARIAAGLGALANSAGRGISVRLAREVQLGDFHRGENVILLGSSASNPWVELFQDQLDFQIHYDPARSRQGVRIRNPKPDDPAGFSESVQTGVTGEAYAAIALVNGLDGKGRVLILQGANMEGTDVAGQLALDSERTSAELRKCGINPAAAQANFELLLRLRTVAGSTRRSEVIAAHCRP